MIVMNNQCVKVHSLYQFISNIVVVVAAKTGDKWLNSRMKCDVRIPNDSWRVSKVPFHFSENRVLAFSLLFTVNTSDTQVKVSETNRNIFLLFIISCIPTTHSNWLHLCNPQNHFTISTFSGQTKVHTCTVGTASTTLAFI